MPKLISQACASAPSRNVDYTINLLYTVAITYLVPVNSLLSKYCMHVDGSSVKRTWLYSLVFDLAISLYLVSDDLDNSVTSICCKIKNSKPKISNHENEAL